VVDERVGEVLHLAQSLNEERERHGNVWDEIVDEIYPIRWGTWKNKERRGERHGSNIYDSYPLQMANISGDGIQGHLVSDSFRWFTVGLSKGSRDPAIRRYLQEVDDQLYSEFQRSNFYEAIGEYINDAQILGTGHLYAQEAMSGGKVSFRCLNPYDVWIDENFDGIVDTHIRHFYLTVRQAYEDEVARIGDMAESKLYEAMRDGDISAVKWYLGRVKRGKYAQRQEISGPDGGPLVVVRWNGTEDSD